MDEWAICMVDDMSCCVTFWGILWRLLLFSLCFACGQSGFGHELGWDGVEF